MTTWTVLDTASLIQFLEDALAGRVQYPAALNVAAMISRLYTLAPEFPEFPCPVVDWTYLGGMELLQLLQGYGGDSGGRAGRKATRVTALSDRVRCQARHLRKNQGRSHR